MGTREFIAKGSMLRIDSGPALGLRVVAGGVWVTRHDDTKDHVLEPGAEMDLPAADGPSLVTAFKPSLVELYREDAGTVRAAIERRARIDRNVAMFGAFKAACGFVLRCFARKRIAPAPVGARRRAEKI